MSERKLATIRRIDALNPIEGADKIEVATIGGWKVVCQKGLYSVGDLVVYCEIDSWIPTEVAPFLTKEGQEPKEFYREKGERLRTVKLRGQISQGLILPLSETNVMYNDSTSHTNLSELNLEEGADVTELLGILKYEAPIPACLSGMVKGAFPSWIPKTDEERIQNLSNEWEDIQRDDWFVTEKVDGTSFTCYIKGDEFGVCSRNMDLKETEGNTHWKVARALGLEEKMRDMRESFGRVDFAIQAELLGEGIQKNRYNIKGHDIYVFNIYNITDGVFFGFTSVENMCRDLGINTVPLISNMWNLREETIESLLKKADASSTLNPNTTREGIVFKTYNREKSFKVISNKFLAKNE